jgi:cell division septal protein FtsQ
MLRRNPDILALGFLVLVIGAVSLAADASSFLIRNLNVERQEHLSRKVELIGERVEAKAKAIEQNATRMAERLEKEAQRHAERAERLSKVWE